LGATCADFGGKCGVSVGDVTMRWDHRLGIPLCVPPLSSRTMTEVVDNAAVETEPQDQGLFYTNLNNESNKEIYY